MTQPAEACFSIVTSPVIGQNIQIPALYTLQLPLSFFTRCKLRAQSGARKMETPPNTACFSVRVTLGELVS